MKLPSLKHQLRVCESAIHGKGLFATEPIDNGTLIGICRAVPTRIDGPYTLSTEWGDVVVTCRLRFINHSPSPNVAYYDDLTVMAIRDIAAGDELTHDYGTAWSQVLAS